MSELPKTFDPAAIEERWYAHWEERGLFRPDRGDATPWTIVMPPPNVTGSLHIGHALDITLQDVLTRRERMLGKDALWVVGTDHAGIATQMVVERNLEEPGIKRADYQPRGIRRHGVGMEGRKRRGDHPAAPPPRRQLRLGARALHHGRGLPARGHPRVRRAVQARPRLPRQAPGQLGPQVPDRDQRPRGRDARVQGKFWTLTYPLADGSGAIEVATTRPETMLADMAVAVHPDDKRYKKLIGKQVKHPITGRLIPIVADEHADPELGSGAVKITPGHDFNDFEVGERAGFKPADMLNMFDADARTSFRRRTA